MLSVKGKCMLSGKVIITYVIVAKIKMISSYKMSFFPEPYSHSKKMKYKLVLSNYATKSDLKSATGIDTSKFAKNTDSARLKSDADK